MAIINPQQRDTRMTFQVKRIPFKELWDLLDSLINVLIIPKILLSYYTIISPEIRKRKIKNLINIVFHLKKKVHWKSSWVRLNYLHLIHLSPFSKSGLIIRSLQKNLVLLTLLRAQNLNFTCTLLKKRRRLQLMRQIWEKKPWLRNLKRKSKKKVMMIKTGLLITNRKTQKIRERLNTMIPIKNADVKILTQ